MSDPLPGRARGALSAVIEAPRGRRDGPLVIAPGLWAYTEDRTPAEYADEYWARYQAYKRTPRGLMLAALRVALCGEARGVLDVGIGNGEFLTAVWQHTKWVRRGCDVNPHARAWLDARAIRWDWGDPPPAGIDTLCFWDSLEHLPDPDPWMRLAAAAGRLCLSLPVWDRLESALDVMDPQSPTFHHYRPREHLYYFTPAGVERYAAVFGFRLEAANREEERLGGRRGVMSFRFRAAQKSAAGAGEGPPDLANAMPDHA